MYRRFKRLFRSRGPSYDPYPDSYNQERINPTSNSPYPPMRIQNRKGINDNDDDNDENVRNDTPLQQPTLSGQTTPRTPLDEIRPLTPIPTSESRPTSNGIRPDVSPNNNNNNNNNINPTMNTETLSSNPSTRAGLPTQETSSDPPINSNVQPPLPPINPLPQPTLPNRFPTLINRNQYPFRMSPNTVLVGFPGNQNRQRLSFTPSSFTPRQNHSSYPTRLFPSRTQTKLSNIQIDYPIENVIIDENIPSSIALKINDAVEYDRFGNVYHTQYYAYKPKTQHIVTGNNQQMERQFIGNSHRSGMRYIREINNEKYYPQKQTSNNVQLIIENTPQINCLYQYELNSFPGPINHFIAYASSNDPMRCY